LGLLHGCHLAEHLFAGLNLADRKGCLAALANTELVGREVSAATANSLDVVSRALSEVPLSF